MQSLGRHHHRHRFHHCQHFHRHYLQLHCRHQLPFHLVHHRQRLFHTHSLPNLYFNRTKVRFLFLINEANRIERQLVILFFLVFFSYISGSSRHFASWIRQSIFGSWWFNCSLFTIFATRATSPSTSAYASASTSASTTGKFRKSHSFHRSPQLISIHFWMFRD